MPSHLPAALHFSPPDWPLRCLFKFFQFSAVSLKSCHAKRKLPFLSPALSQGHSLGLLPRPSSKSYHLGPQACPPARHIGSSGARDRHAWNFPVPRHPWTRLFAWGAQFPLIDDGIYKKFRVERMHSCIIRGKLQTSRPNCQQRAFVVRDLYLTCRGGF